MKTAKVFVTTFIALLTASAGALFAQVQSETLFAEDFQSYQTQSAAPGWTEYRVGVLVPQAPTRFRIIAEPQNPANHVYSSSAPRSRLVSPAGAVPPRVGEFSLIDRQFFLAPRLVLRGRFMISAPHVLAGFPLLASYPGADQYYLLGVWPDSDRRTIRLFSENAGTFSGQLDSNITAEINRWYQVLIEIGDEPAGTTVRARIWPAGASEPTGYSIDAVDSSPSRLREGKLGVWTAGGVAIFDDLRITTEFDASQLRIVVTESGNRIGDGAKFNRNVSFDIKVLGGESPTFTATLDGAPYTLGVTVTSEGQHQLLVEARDAGGKTASSSIRFLIDKTPPSIHIASHQSDAVLRSNRVVISGDAGDAVQVLVNGLVASINAARQFVSPELVLQEGRNTILVTAVDEVGNTARAELVLIVDAAPAPLVTISSPAAGSCLDSTSLTVTGTSAGSAGINVTLGNATAPATIESDGRWQATFANVPEGRQTVRVEARSSVGEVSVLTLQVTVDRAAPAIDVSESGIAFAGGPVNRAIAPFVRVSDTDPTSSLTLSLDGAAFTSGTTVSAEGSHRLEMMARDCAGHETRRTVDFVIDRTAPALSSFAPASDSTLARTPVSISGATSADVATVEILDTTYRTSPASSGAFTLADVALNEGVNTLRLRATDHAGNIGEATLVLRLRTEGPGVEILVSGSSIDAGTLFNRSIAPTIRSNDPSATITATLNNAPFTSGNTISADGQYELIATAADSIGNSSRAQASFSIDATAPAVRITSPTGTVNGDRASVTGAAGDSIRVVVNGIEASLANGTFTASVPLEFEETLVTATGYDRAGNAGRDSTTLRREAPGPAIIILFPTDRSITNRVVTDIVGQVLTPPLDGMITLGSTAQGKLGGFSTSVPVDPTGRFHVSNFPLSELENSITASARSATGSSSSVLIRITADFTPPSLTILESGQPFSDSARVPTRAVLSLEARDPHGPIRTELLVDGVSAPMPATVITTGGHTLVAIARDAAGNQTRLEQTFFVGSGGGGGCALSAFDPADGAIVSASRLTLGGQSGGASRVRINGLSVTPANGSFCTTIELPAEGPNVVSIVCTDAEGNPTGTPATLTLIRVTNEPTLTIDTPQEGSYVAMDTLNVTGGATADTSVTVNNSAATLSSGRFTATARLNAGLNILAARARSSAARTATATRRIIYLKDAPALTVTSPGASPVTGAPRTDISGTYSNLDPATILVTGPAGSSANRQVSVTSDTTGTFRLLEVPLIVGSQTLTITARDPLNRTTTANVVVTHAPGAPSVEITQPLDNQTFGAGSGDSFEVRGTFSAQPGATVEVNGTVATVSGSSFSAAVRFSTVTPMTPVVARVTEPGGAVGLDSIRVSRLAQAPRVLETVPAAGATGIDSATLISVSFSTPMSRDSLSSGGFRMETSSGVPVSGILWLDREVLSFAPGATLSPGETYNIRITTAATDVGGNSMAAESRSSFTVAAAASSTAPAIDPIASPICAETLPIRGRAAPLSRVRLDSGSLTLATTADASGNFTFQFPAGARAGCQVVRVRTLGADGTFSPAAEATFVVDCVGPIVIHAAFDRSTNLLTVDFSKAVKPTTIVGSSSVLLRLDDLTTVSGTIEVAGTRVTMTPVRDLRTQNFTLTVTTAVEDVEGRHLRIAHSQRFTLGGATPGPGDGTGFITGEVFDAATGRPLAGATVSIDLAGTSALSTPPSALTDERGRYTLRIPEGAHTIRITAPGFASIWRQIVVAAGSGIVPVDIRVSQRGPSTTSTGAPITLISGGDTPMTWRVELSVPAPALSPGKAVSLTAVGGQALAGLLPLGWSPLAAAEIQSDSSTLSGSQLVFNVPYQEILAASQILTAVQYDSEHDEWRVIAPVVNVGNDGRAGVSIEAPGAFVLVYPDKAPRAQPPIPIAGGALGGVPNTCVNCTLVAREFTLDPPVIPPTGRSVATLIIDGSVNFPSGTAVQAYIDEELRLADGTRVSEPPYATDLLLYRTLAGDTAIARFHLAPSTRAAEVVLDIGFSHVRIVPYPGRVDRGSLVGPEGGRASDPKVSIEIPAGAATEAVHARATSLTDAEVQAVGTVPGFRVLAGFRLELTRAESTSVDTDGDGLPDPPRPVELLRPGHAMFTVPSPSSQMVVVEVIEAAPFGRLLRLVAQAGRAGARVATRTIDRARLPLDGIAHDGQYLLLGADAPIAYAFGTVRLGTNGAYLSDVRIHAPPLGVHDVSRLSGFFLVPVPAKPAAPFTLIPRHTAQGEAASFTAPAAPDADAIVNVGDVVFAVQPPQLVAITPANGAKEVPLTTSVRAVFAPAIDPGSVHGSTLAIVDATTGQTVRGNVAPEGTAAVIWTLPPGDALQPNRQYFVHINSDLRGANGAALAQTISVAFSTITQLPNSEIRAERIRITIPDDAGRSRISGAAGALPAGWQAMAMRAGRDFITRYQATAQTDGSFGFSAGGGEDRISLHDHIDLHVINTAGSVAAIIPLTPFIKEDGRGFVAPASEATKFTSAEGVTVSVPQGAFDRPTVIEVTTAPKEAFAEVPAFDKEVNFAGAVRLNFEGKANKPLEVELPVPAGLETKNRFFVLSYLGQSVRGPRVMAVDTLRVVDGKFTTAPAAPSGKVTPQQVESEDNLKKYMIRGTHSGTYGAMDVNLPAGGSLAFAVLDGIMAGVELFSSTLDSFYVADFFISESKGRAVIPVITGRPFEIVGVDASTGLQAFSRVYNPLAPGDPGATVGLPTPQQNTIGPYPVFGTPFRVEIVELDAEETDLEAIRGYKVRLENGFVKVTPGNVDEHVELLNPIRGTFDTNTDDQLKTIAQLGDRIAVLIGEKEVDPSTAISVVFSEPLYLGTQPDDETAVDTFLKQLLRLETKEDDEILFTDVTGLVTFGVDPGGRRVSISSSAPLKRGSLYRLTLKKEITDRSDTGGAGLRLGQIGQLTNGALTPIGSGYDLQLEFRVRAPKGLVSQFELRQDSDTQFGTIRDLALNGNLLFVAAHDGGLLAFDTADPASLTNTSSPIAVVPGRDGDAPALTENWGVATDHHGRVFTTGLTASFGILRSYRVEDFLEAAQTQTGCWSVDHTVCSSVATAAVSWRIGATAGLPLASSTVVSDIPEAIPRKLQITVQDDQVVYNGVAQFQQVTTQGLNLGNGFTEFSLSAPISQQSYPYRIQRITVENMDLDLRWSGDARPGQPALISGIVMRANDRIRVIRNLRTYAVVSLFGYGISVYDVIALESNDQNDGTKKITERLALTRGLAKKQNCNQADTPGGPPCPIASLAFSPEAIIRPGEKDELFVVAADPQRGLLDVRIDPPREVSDGVVPAKIERAAEGLVLSSPYSANGQLGFFENPRVKALRALYKDAPGNPEKREPFFRFSSISPYRWRREGDQNPLGERSSIPGQAVDRTYALVAANDLGLLIVEIHGKPGPESFPAFNIIPGHWPLGSGHLSDTIWIPAGAMSVRTIPRTDLAVVVDGRGEALLVDLSRIDERWKPGGTPVPIDEVFATAKKALQTDESIGDQVGVDDPRIVWRSGQFLGRHTIPPIVDPETGFVYGGTEKVMKVLSAMDPRIQLKVDIGSPAGLVEVGGIVPLGINPPKDVKLTGPNASLAAFRIEVTIPGGAADALGQTIPMALESERVFGAVTAQTLQAPGIDHAYPRAHLRKRRADGTMDPRPANGFALHRVVPPTLAPKLRHQRGFNKFISPWIVAIADPRASAQYVWPPGVDKSAAGCHSCDRPLHLQNLGEGQGVWELWSAGRILLVRPETNLGGSNIFSPSYAYLGEANRLRARFGTIMADTVRPTEVLVAGQNPPVAEGILQETTYLHSGELETSAIDLHVGGRAGWDVQIDRTYRSRTLGWAPLGVGWDARHFQRLRPLPNGNVEYRDGVGEVWLFRFLADGTYERPKGLFLRLSRHADGWKLTDLMWRATSFDNLGRLTSQADEFYDVDSSGKEKGNLIQYLYDAEGRLSQIIDPVGRVTRLSYAGEDSNGALREVIDWRGRKVTYKYDALGRLITVEQPEVKNTAVQTSFNGRPTTKYEYAPSAANFNDLVELSGNLLSIKDPESDDVARVTFGYEVINEIAKRDRVKTQTWATSELAKFEVTQSDPTGETLRVDVTDVLGQKRSYELTPKSMFDGRQHVKKLTIESVVYEPPENLPQADLEASLSSASLVTEIDFDIEGNVLKARLPHGLEIEQTHENAQGGAAGTRVKKVVERKGADQFTTMIGYDSNPGALNNPRAIARAEGNSEPVGPNNVRDAETPSRGRLTTTTRDDDYQAEEVHDDSGQLKQSLLRDSEGVTESRREEYEYYDSSAPRIARGRVKSVTRPSGAVNVKYSYEDLGDGAVRETIFDDAAGTTATTERDALNRPIRQLVKQGPSTLKNERYGYDANGQMVYSARSQTGIGEVETQISYDTLLREIERSESGALVSGNPATLKRKTTYDLATRVITRSDPFISNPDSVATEFTQLDKLGRVESAGRVAADASQQIKRELRYNSQGLLSHETDEQLSATVRYYDAFGRETKSIDSLKQVRTTKFNHWGEAVEETVLGPAAPTSGEISAIQTVLGHSKTDYTRNGGVKQVTEELVGGNQYRSTTYETPDGKRSVVRVAAAGVDGSSIGPVRKAETLFDSAGRAKSSKIGDESGSSALQLIETPEFKGMLPATRVVKEPLATAEFTSKTSFDGLGRPRFSHQPGEFVVENEFDELGNRLLTRVPEHPLPARASYDARGLMTQLIHPDPEESKITYSYDELGNLTRYLDEKGKSTTYETDKLGRVVKVNYPDGTCEQTIYRNNTNYVAATRDRAGKWLLYNYNGYLLENIKRGEAPPGTGCNNVLTSPPAPAEMLVKYDYDGVRLRGIYNTDAAVEFKHYDLTGRPQTTRTIRYRDHTGLTTKQVLDVHAQTHIWSAFEGERSRYRMPAAGDEPSPSAAPSPWRSWIEESRDAAGNLITIRSVGSSVGTESGVVIAESTARGVGRLKSRTRPLGGAESIKTLYAYAEPPSSSLSAPAVPGPESGLLGRAETVVSEGSVAGSVVTRDLARRISHSEALGLGGRESKFTFDDRDRLTQSILGAIPDTETQPSIVDQLDATDFRLGRQVSRFTAAERATLGPSAAEIETSSWTATPGDAHQIESLDFEAAGLPDFDFTWTGGRRSGDGTWNAKYDEFGRLRQLTRVTPKDGYANRYEYDYNAQDRLVGRRVCENTNEADCVLETRANVLARDGLPAQTTFVWDPVSDRLLAIYEAAKSTGAQTPNEYAGLLRQYVHGDQSYDDPVEIFIADPAGGAPKRYLPVLEEAGTGSLTAVLSDTGTLVERLLYGDAYGADPRYLHGPVVGRITARAKRSSSGQITEVKISVHLSDAIRAQTLPAGAKLRSMRDDGTAAYVSTASAVLESDPHSFTWTLSQTQWNALINAAGATAIEVAVTRDLSAVGWGDVAVMNAPAWMEKVSGTRSSPTEPVIQPRNLTELFPGTQLDHNLYELRDLYLAASPESKSKLLTGFQGAPFVEPTVGFAYFRARWYEPSTGTFLSPDPLRYEDSANLYAFGADDPVNNRDPKGMGLGDWWDARTYWEGGFVGDTVHDVWNVASLGTLSRVENQKNLGTLSGVGESVFQGVRSISNAASLGLQESIYETQMHEGAGLKSIGKGALQGVVNLTPYEEIKTLATDSSLTPEEKIRLGFTAVAKTAALAAVARGFQNRGAQLTTAARPPRSLAATSGSGVGGTVIPIREAFHHTFTKYVGSIEQYGLRAGSYATPTGGLSPLQAHLELALPPTRGLPEVVLRIDIAGMRQAGYQIPSISRVSNVVRAGGRTYSMPGGGYQMQFDYPIPPEFIRVVP